MNNLPSSLIKRLNSAVRKLVEESDEVAQILNEMREISRHEVALHVDVAVGPVVNLPLIVGNPRKSRPPARTGKTKSSLFTPRDKKMLLELNILPE